MLKNQEDVFSVMDKIVEDETLEEITYFRRDFRSLIVNVGWEGNDLVTSSTTTIRRRVIVCPLLDLGPMG